MSLRNGRMILVAFSDPNMFYQSAPERLRDPDRFKLGNFIDHAKLAEASGFDAIFKPDFLGFDPSKSGVKPRAGFEPLTLLTALSQHTSRVGLIATESTSYNEPYNVARWFTSLDNISGGRASWNVVTSYYGEENFGNGKLLPLAERYRRADEFMALAYKLWSGWKKGAVRYANGAHRFSAEFIEQTNFTGRYFSVKEPLDIPPGPQGRPVIVQAGASEEGLDFAAKHAEIVFAATPTLEAGVSFYGALKRRVKARERDPDTLKILPGLNIFVGRTAAEATEQYDRQFTDRSLLDYRNKVVREAPLFRLDELDLDDTIPASAIPTEAELYRVERRRSRGLLLREYLLRPGITLRQFLTSTYEFGHLTLIGTPESVATGMATWLKEGAADGFVLKGGNSFETVATEVLPILRDRGLVKTPIGEDLTFRQALFGSS